MSHRHNPRKYKGVTKHEKHTRATAKPPVTDSEWRLRKVLRALADGGRLVFDKARQTWYAITAAGRFGRMKVKRGLMLELLRSKFLTLKLTLSNWGRIAAQATV